MTGWLSLASAVHICIVFVEGSSSGCNVAHSRNAVRVESVRKLDGRKYWLRLPQTYSPRQPHSLIISLHGMMATPQAAPFYDTPHALLPERLANVVFAFAEGVSDVKIGISRAWNGSGSVGSPGPKGPTCKKAVVGALHPGGDTCRETCVQSGGCKDICWLSDCADDVSFVLDIARDIEKHYCIDQSSRHAVGFSAGGWLALELGTNPYSASYFSSIVAIASVPFLGFNHKPLLRAGSRFLGIWGSADKLVPAFSTDHANFTLAYTGWMFETWQSTSQTWASTMECRDLTHPQAIIDTGNVLNCFEHKCPRGMVSVCLWDGEHAIPPGALHMAWRTFFPTQTEIVTSGHEGAPVLDLISPKVVECFGFLVFMFIAAAVAFRLMRHRESSLLVPFVDKQTVADH